MRILPEQTRIMLQLEDFFLRFNYPLPGQVEEEKITEYDFRKKFGNSGNVRRVLEFLKERGIVYVENDGSKDLLRFDSDVYNEYIKKEFYGELERLGFKIKKI